MTSTFQERTVELSLVSAVDLKKVKNLGAQHCYIVAYIYHNQRKETQPDRLGGLNPVWNTKLTLQCEEELLQSPASYLTVEIKCHGTLHNKLVGTVTVPLHDLLLSQDNSKKTDFQVLAYDVHRPSGKVQGTLNMAVKLGDVKTVQRYRSQQTPFGYPPAAAGGSRYRPPFAPPHMQNQNQYYGGGYPPMQPQMGYPSRGGGGMWGGGGYPGGMMGGGGYGAYPQPRPRRGGMGFGTGLMGGALGGLLVGDMIGDHYNDDYNDYGSGDYGGGGMDDMGDMGGE